MTYYKNLLIYILFFFIVCFIGSGILLYFTGFRINTTPSEPIGLWRSYKHYSSISKGNLVEACVPPSEIMIEAKKRGYLLSGKCKGNLAPVIKKIIAISGDTVTISKNGVFVNGVQFSNQLSFYDSKGRILKPAFLGNYVLKSNEVFLASNYSTKSFDSRYFGIVNKKNILHKMKPIFVTYWKPKGY